LIDPHSYIGCFKTVDIVSTEVTNLYTIIMTVRVYSRIHETYPLTKIEKPLLRFQGKPVLTHVIEAAAARVVPERIVVVGPQSLPTGNIATVYEEPPRSGPYMGVYTGLQYFAQQFGPATVAEGVLLLGADMPRIAQGLTQLFDHHDAATHAGVAITQAAGRLQPLL